MKKFLIIIFSLILLLCSCKEKKYELIEISADELVNYFYNEKIDLVVAFYDESLEHSDEFLNDLESLVSKSKMNVYYVDMGHIAFVDRLMIESFIDTDEDTSNYGSLRYIAFKDGYRKVDEKYTNFARMYSDLNGKRSGDVELISDEDKQSTLDNAKELYEDGYISQAYNLCMKVWNYEPTKEYVNDNNLFKLFNEWEYQEYDEDDKVNYKNMVFLSFEGVLFMIDETVDKSEFEKEDLTYEDSYYFKVNNGNNLCIFLDNGDDIYDGDEECIDEYEILFISDDLLRLKKEEKEFDFTTMKEVG